MNQARLALSLALRPFLGLAGWLPAVLVLLAWGSGQELQRLAIAVGTHRDSGRETLFLSGLVGASLVLARCKDLRWVLGGLGGFRRLSTLALALAGGILSQQILVCALLPRPVTVDPTSLALTDAHLMAAATLLGCLPLTALERAWTLPVLAWILPTLIGTDSGIGVGVRTLLGASHHLAAASPVATATRPVTAADMIPIAALALAAVLLDGSSKTAR